MNKSLYSRRITDLLPKGIKKPSFLKEITLAEIQKYLILCLVIVFFMLSAALYYFYGVYRQSKAKMEAEYAHLYYWESVIKEHPNYPDALYNASYYSLRVGNKIKAYKYISTALLVDPSFREAQVLKKQIEILR